MTGHPWLLVAPWWHWPRQGGDPRSTRPGLQKYDGPEFVNTFLERPQHRLKFLEDVDRVVRYAGGSAFVPPTKVLTGLRKLFLPTHARHYLVACSLHCDMPGLPAVDRAQVCEAGFVVRRRRYALGEAKPEPAAKYARQVAAARRMLASAETQIAAARSAPTPPGVKLAALQLRREEALKRLAEATVALRSWANAAGANRRLEAWFQDRTGDGDPLANQGRWAGTPEVPDVLTEATFPMWPLVAPGTEPAHDGAGQAVWFGVVPVGSADVDAIGKARFDDTSAYEIRCWVRRHDPRCPRQTGRQDCQGELVWSEPTEPFGLASHSDLRGTANRPVTVQLPDLKALQAEAGTTPPGGVRFKTPPFSKPENTGDGREQICSFSIPLITIVAFFVFQLFLPIVVFLFQLWFLLLLKFCIPPEVSLDGAVAGALDISPGALSVDATFNAWFGVVGPKLQEGTGLREPAMRSKMVEDPQAKLKNAGSRTQLLAFAKQLLRPGELTWTDDRVYEPRVRREEVLPV